MHTHRPTLLLILCVCVTLSHNTSIFRDRQKTLTKEKEKDPDSENLIKVSIGAILPFSSFKHITRLYDMSLNTSRFTKYRSGYTFTKVYRLQTPRETLALSASPRTVLETLCDRILPHNVSAIMYMTNAQLYGSNAATAQYMLQLTGYLGLPVIAWNVDNVGLEQRVSDSRILQLAPTVEHQARVMLSILVRYSWHTFSVVTSQIGGHDDFIRAVRDLLQRGFSTSPFSHDSFKFDILNVISLKSDTKEGYKNELELIADSEARIFLLFATRMEAVNIMAAAKELGITGKHYVWIASQSVVGSEFDIKTRQFPTGMLGLYVNVTNERLYMEMERAVNIFAHGLESFHKDTKKGNTKLSPQLSCNETGMARWHRGDVLFKHMRSNIFNLDGTLKDVEILVMNLKHIRWEQIGVWSGGNLTIRDIVWPGNSPVPPPGVPEKFNLKITFLKEPPYVNLLPPDNETGECKTSRSVRCRVAPEEKLLGMNHTEAVRNPEFYKCCSGFCIDLLQKFSQDLKFTYDLYQVEDGAWGVVNKGTWNGLIAEVLNNKADIVVTSIKINSDRQTVVDFTVPFLETGIAIVVAKRTGIISPKAFLEPFDTISWLMILLVCIQGAALAIFVFEWLSPYGYDMKMVPPREDTNGPDHKFSLFRTYWLVWAILFGAAVNVDCPRGYTARFMSSVWSMFAVVFLAIYTANLAAFMITREEYYDLTGIDDKRLQNPHSVEPPFRYGTIPYGNTEAILRKNKEHLFDWMRKFNRSSVIKGVAAVKTGELDAFIYDATVLEYLAGQDNECRLLTVGSWYAMTGYGFALSKHSKYLSMFNRWMIKYRENGDLERLQRFWLQGACKPKHKKRNVSKPLDVNQFMSAFLLLGGGVLFTIMVLLLEHIYFKYIRQHLEKTDKGGCLTLISLSMGKSLNFRGAVQEATDIIIHHKCKNPICDTTLRKIKHDLQLAQLKIEELTAMNNMMGGSIAPTNNKFKKTEPLKTRDLTHNMIMSTETGEPGFKSDYTEAYGPHFIKTSMTPAHVAEIETVL